MSHDSLSYHGCLSRQEIIELRYLVHRRHLLCMTSLLLHQETTGRRPLPASPPCPNRHDLDTSNTSSLQGTSQITPHPVLRRDTVMDSSTVTVCLFFLFFLLVFHVQW